MVMRRRLAVAASIAVAFGVLVVAPACGSGFLEGLSGGSRDAGADTAPAIDAGADARACTPHRAPPPPAEQQDTEVPGTLVLALDGFRIDDSSTVDASVSPSRGFDIDNACTCPEPESCAPPPDAGPKKCDGDGGTDNSLGRMFSELGSVFPVFGPDFATKEIRTGAYGALMSIGGWNREPNDPKIFVSIFLSQGSEVSVDGGDQPLKLDGTDVWTIDPASVLDGDNNIGVDCETEIQKCLPAYSATGYVADNVLVARLNAPIAISASTGRIVIEMQDMAVAVKLVKDGANYRADGEFTGRWPVEKVLRSLAEVPIQDVPICESAFFGSAQAQVCAGVDVTSDPSGDHKGERCNAVSAAFHFTGMTALRGRIYRPELPPPACPTTFNPTCP